MMGSLRDNGLQPFLTFWTSNVVKTGQRTRAATSYDAANELTNWNAHK